jgi:hypothetical protein
MGITEAIARRQYQAAKRAGWLPFVIEASEAFDIAPEIILAVCSRETNLNASYLHQAGDGGNGYGLMQVDRRAFPQWVRAGLWRDARECFMKGSEILAGNRSWLQDHAGKPVVVKDSRGNRRSFTLPVFSGELLMQVAIGMYNGGPWVASNPAYNKPVDVSTTGKDYSTDVLERAEYFDSLLDADVQAGDSQVAPDSEVDATSSGQAVISTNEQAGVSASSPQIAPADSQAAATFSAATATTTAEQQPAQSSSPQQASIAGIPLPVTSGEGFINKATAAVGTGGALASVRAFASHNTTLIVGIVAAIVLLLIVYIICTTFLNHKRIEVGSNPEKLNVK